MRIVAGKFRRRKLLTNTGLVTRPITDRAKEILFEHLKDEVEGARVADVFAGTGTLGLEALSRAAHSVVFVENDRRAWQMLKRNVDSLRAGEETLCWKTDALRCSFRPKGVSDFVPFDLVFFDPPYRMIEQLEEGRPLYRSLVRLARDDSTSPDCLLMLRTPLGATFRCPDAWQPDRSLDISSMTIHLMRKKRSDARPSAQVETADLTTQLSEP